MARRLRTFEGVIDALGGTVAVAALTKRRPQAVSMWKKRGALFPPSTYFLVSEALARVGCDAPRTLWRFDEQQQRDEAA